jgi:hypothetical protein
MSATSNAAASIPAQRSPTTGADGVRWRDLIAEFGAEIAHPLTLALERVNALTSGGRVDRAGLRLLREEIETARQLGMTAQLLARFASAGLSQSRERVALLDSLQSVLTHRKRETDARGISVQPAATPVDVIVDASLMFSLLNTLTDWALTQTRSAIDLIIDVDRWKGLARLTCRFGLIAADGSTPVPPLDTLTWRLLEQTAVTMQLGLARQVNDRTVTVTLEFALPANADIEGVSPVDLDQGFDSSMNSKPLAGSHVVVVASRRVMRARIRDALRHMGLIVDMVASIDEAADFCSDGLPHAIIVEGILHGERFDRFCADIRAEVPGFPFIDIVEEGKEFNVSDDSGVERARVGQDAIEAALPSVLMFELSRIL